MRLDSLFEKTPIAKKNNASLPVLDRPAAVQGKGFPPDLKWIVIRPSVLDGEKIVVVYHRQHVRDAMREYPDLVVYFIEEIEELRLCADLYLITVSDNVIRRTQRFQVTVDLQEIPVLHRRNKS